MFPIFSILLFQLGCYDEEEFSIYAAPDAQLKRADLSLPREGEINHLGADGVEIWGGCRYRWEDNDWQDGHIYAVSGVTWRGVFRVLADGLAATSTSDSFSAPKGDQGWILKPPETDTETSLNLYAVSCQPYVFIEGDDGTLIEDPDHEWPKDSDDDGPGRFDATTYILVGQE